MTPAEIEQTIAFLHNLQSWRKRADIPMPEPKEIDKQIEDL